MSPLLFVIVMDVLGAMFREAERRDVLSDLAAYGLRHRVSLFADDVVIFARPEVRKLGAVRAILQCFGSASGLQVNFAKSAVMPIRCAEELINEVAPTLDCPIKALPCTYLGLPLSVRKLTQADLQPILDKLANKLSFWKARLLSKDGRLIYVQAVMTSSVIYQLMALDLEPWFLEAVDKLRRGFFWVGSSGGARASSSMVHTGAPRGKIHHLGGAYMVRKKYFTKIWSSTRCPVHPLACM